MEQFLNADRAIEYKDSIADPIVRELVMHAYGCLMFRTAPAQLDGQFDLLFFFKVMEAFLKDKEWLAEVLLNHAGET